MSTVKQPVDIETGLYERDFYEWSMQMATKLKNRDLAGLDWDNVAEEIESLGRRDKRELASRIEVVIAHLLKWRASRGLGGDPAQSWKNTLYEQHRRLGVVLEESPSLRRTVPAILDKVYPHARRKAALEMNLGPDNFPAHCPFTPEEILNEDFLPE